MSLLEDIVDLLRCVLEYFGVPADMLVPVWDSTHCGQYRSIVRMIGTNLPLSPYPRLRFQIPLQTFNKHGHIDVSVDSVVAIPTLADVLWLVEDEGDSHTKFRNAVPLRKCCVQGFEIPSLGCERPVSAPVPAQRGGVIPGQSVQPEALLKISALEEELQRLRAQIAMIVTASAGPVLLPADPGTPRCAPLPSPVLTSTPVCPPPPPPPPPALGSSVEVSVTEVIRQRQAAKREKQSPCDAPPPAAQPSMLEVLRDLNQVKLRSVERSPGGTPVKRRRSKGVSSSSDPTAFIAEALKRKFAHRVKDDSFGKENHSAEPSPFSSPDTPRIAHHTRRSKGRFHL